MPPPGNRSSLSFALSLEGREVAVFRDAEGLSGELHVLAGKAGPYVVLSTVKTIHAREFLLPAKRRPVTLDDASITVSAADGARLALLDLGDVSVCLAIGNPLLDLVLMAPGHVPLPQHTVEVWQSLAESAHPTPGRWEDYTTTRRRALLFAMKMAHFVAPRSARGNESVPDNGYVLDGARTTDAPGLFLEIGEAFCDIGGYMGGDLDGLQDFLRQVPRPGTVRWVNAATARRRLSSDSWRREEWRHCEIRQNGESDRSLFSAVNAVFQSSGFEVSCDDGGLP